MRTHRAGMQLLALSLLFGCGSSPLLKMAGADYSPWRLGSDWIYQNPAGAAAFERKVVGSGMSNGFNAFQVNTYDFGLGTTTTTQVYDAGSSIQIYSLVSGWVVDRKLPYVVGNNWDMPSPGPNLSQKRFVDGVENVATPAGTFVRCFRLRDEIDSFDSSTGLTSTTGDYIWAAPDVGDVQYAGIDINGVVTVTARLSSYSLGQ
jgi:hypothetical protein